MASLSNNPFKRYKMAAKGKKLSGNEVHDMMKKKSANWIQGAIKKPGALHKELGIASGKKIPAKTLASAAKKPGKEGKRARLAETLKGMKHKKAGRKEPTVGFADIEKKSAKKRKGTLGFDDVESKKSTKKKAAMCMKCKTAHEKGKHTGKK